MRATATVHSAEQEGATETEVTLMCREERIACEDAKHRVWKAFDLIGQHLVTAQRSATTIQEVRKLSNKGYQRVKSLPLLRLPP